MDVGEVQAKAILLIQRNSDDEIYKFIGNAVPVASIKLLHDVRSYSIKQLPGPDKKMLPPSEKAEEPKKIGKMTFAVIKRIVWKTFCKPDSTIYKLWKNKVPRVFDQGYFSAAIVTTLNDFRIGLPLIASGIAALIMKYTAEEFCLHSKPKGLMIDRGKE
jgi:hypothetical protein